MLSKSLISPCLSFLFHYSEMREQIPNSFLCDLLSSRSDRMIWKTVPTFKHKSCAGMIEQLMEMLCLAPKPALGLCLTFFVQAAIRGHPTNCLLRSNMTCLGWLLECWCGLGSQSYGVFLQPGFLDDLAAFEKSPRSTGKKKQQERNCKASAQCIWVSSCSVCIGRVPTGNSDGTGFVGWEWPFLPAGNKKYDCFPLPHMILKTRLVWFESTFRKPILVSGCRGEMFMDSDWLCAHWKWLSRVRLWQVWPSSTLGLCVHGLGVVCDAGAHHKEGCYGAPETYYLCRPELHWCLEGLMFSSVPVQAFCV